MACQMFFSLHDGRRNIFRFTAAILATPIASNPGRGNKFGRNLAVKESTKVAEWIATAELWRVIK